MLGCVLPCLLAQCSAESGCKTLLAVSCRHACGTALRPVYLEQCFKHALLIKCYIFCLPCCSGGVADMSAALEQLGVQGSSRDSAQDPDELVRITCTGLFDTTGSVDPFAADSPIRDMAVERFPSELFFVLRVVHMMRGLARGMGVEGFSSAQQWVPLAEQVLREQQQQDSSNGCTVSGASSLADAAVPLSTVS